MTYIEMVRSVAENITQLADDGETIKNGNVTETGIKKKLNSLYRDTVFNVLVDSFPEDFTQETRWTTMYTQSGTVDASADGTTLVATTGIFSSNDVNVSVYNSTDGAIAEITDYTSSTTVTTDVDISDWVGDTIYVLQNTFTFGGDAVDLREVLSVYVDYGTGIVRKARRLLRTDRDYHNIYTTSNPAYVLTSVDVGGVTKPAITIFPAPTNASAKYKLVYTEKPAEMTSDSDEPVMKNIGISEVLIAGATAWAAAIKKETALSSYWNGEFDKWLGMMVRKYKPANRDNPPTTKMSSYFEYIRTRRL